MTESIGRESQGRRNPKRVGDVTDYSREVDRPKKEKTVPSG